MYQEYPQENFNNTIFMRPQPGDTVQQNDQLLPQQQMRDGSNQPPRLVGAAVPSNEMHMKIVLDVVVRVSKTYE